MVDTQWEDVFHPSIINGHHPDDTLLRVLLEVQYGPPTNRELLTTMRKLEKLTTITKNNNNHTNY